jgi:hypothetical protein
MRLVLAATFVGAVGALSFLPHEEVPPQVEWTTVDETNPIFPPISPSPDYDGDGTPGPDEEGGSGDGDVGEDGNGSGPEGGGDVGDPEVNDPERRSSSEDGGLLGLSFPAQAGLSIGLIALAFLALLPGRRMPENLR